MFVFVMTPVQDYLTNEGYLIVAVNTEGWFLNG